MKLSKKQLKELQDLVESRRDYRVQLGDLSMYKQNILVECAGVDRRYKTLLKGLQDKYGEDMEVSLKDGTITGASNDLKKS